MNLSREALEMAGKIAQDAVIGSVRTMLRLLPDGFTAWHYQCHCGCDIWGLEKPDDRASSGRAMEFQHDLGVLDDALSWATIKCPACDATVRRDNPNWCRMLSGACSIFVFGSNLAGIHGAGAARFARQFYGAVNGVGRGPTGDAYAIPTKDLNIDTLPLDWIAFHVGEFINYAKDHPLLRFNVTRIGCGLAGYTDADIAPLFGDAPDNCLLPEGWRNLCKSTSTAPVAAAAPA